ncbi:MAG: Rab family GTPase [Candidatus Thorarchaeota archaeon]
MRGTIRRQYKVCLIGDGYVGKTSVRRKYMGVGFRANYIPTLGVDFAQHSITHDDVPTNLIIWDIAGQPLFANLRKRYYDGCSGIIIVFSTISRETFDAVSKWLVEAHEFMKELPALVIVGNKIDLRPGHPKEETVSTEEGRVFTKKTSESLNTPAIYIETSAKTGENIEEAFLKLVRMMGGETVEEEPVVEHESPSPPKQDVISSETDTEVEIASSSEAVHTEDDTVTSSETAHVEAASVVSSAKTIESFTEPKPLEEIPAHSEAAEIDPVTSLASDSEYLKEDQIGTSMTRLVNLRSELRAAEEDLVNNMSEFEKSLHTLRNQIHVSKIMYDHLHDQLQTTRKEWSDAYEEYSKVDKKKNDELAKKSKQIETIRIHIEKIGRTIRKRVDELDLKKITE